MGDVVSISSQITRPGGTGRLPMRRGTPAVAHYERGCALERSQPALAAEAYERALAGRPDLADAHCNLGRLHHERGDLAAAEGAYRLAICVDPGVGVYWFNLGVVVEDRGRYAEAIAAYEQAIAVDASCADAHFNLARLFRARRLRSRVAATR